MDVMEKDETSSVPWSVLLGAAIGAAAGLMYAPKIGREMREDLAEWGRRNGEKAQTLFSAVLEQLPPAAAKAAASYGIGKKEESASGRWFMLIGAGIGTAIGLLYAPKVGSELRGNLADWTRRFRSESEGKTSNAYGNVKSGAREAKEKVNASFR